LTRTTILTRDSRVGNSPYLANEGKPFEQSRIQAGACEKPGTKIKEMPRKTASLLIAQELSKLQIYFSLGSSKQWHRLRHRATPEVRRTNLTPENPPDTRFAAYDTSAFL
jgi:hypothetical protein